MKSYKDVRGTQPDRPDELEVNVDTVYVRANIRHVEDEEFTGWQYDEDQYELKEYIRFIGGKNKELKDADDLITSELAKVKIELMMLKGGVL